MMLRSARLCVVVAFATAFALTAASPAWTQVHAAGGVRVSDELDCPPGGNDPTVGVPFSIEITGLIPFTDEAQMFVTDMDEKIEYGPIMIQDVDKQGRACVNVLRAPPGQWKIEVVEQGSGFTDSKVITIEGPPEPTTTTES